MPGANMLGLMIEVGRHKTIHKSERFVHLSSKLC